MTKNNQMMIGAIIAILVVGGAAFFGGMKYQQSQNGNRFNQLQNRMNGGMRQGMGAQQGRFGGAVMGEVISKDDKSITVKMQDGSSKIVLLSGDVTVSKTDTASKDDLKTGIQVAVFGASNSDGTVTAQNIQLNPMFRMGRGQASPSSSPK